MQNKSFGRTTTRLLDKKKKRKEKKRKEKLAYTSTHEFTVEISLTTVVSWSFPSKGRNSRMHTSKLLEFTFSNQTYIASFGFVSRVYLADTNTDGLPGKFCNVVKYMNLFLWIQYKSQAAWQSIIQDEEMYRIVEREKLEISPNSSLFLSCRVWTLQPTAKISEYWVACLNEHENPLAWSG